MSWDLLTAIFYLKYFCGHKGQILWDYITSRILGFMSANIFFWLPISFSLLQRGVADKFHKESKFLYFNSENLGKIWKNTIHMAHMRSCDSVPGPASWVNTNSHGTVYSGTDCHQSDCSSKSKHIFICFLPETLFTLGTLDPRILCHGKATQQFFMLESALPSVRSEHFRIIFRYPKLLFLHLTLSDLTKAGSDLSNF